MRIVIFGPQGSGKDTQADLLATKYGLPAIATGNLFRQEIQERSELGKIAEKYIDRGNLVPDDLVAQILLKRLKQPDCQNGFILNGYPRNETQVKKLNEILAELRVSLTQALLINISDREAIHRLGGRRICHCGATYHLQYNPPREEGKCDKCGRELFIRDDDKEEAIKKRLEIYHQDTEPILKYYRGQGLLVEINGEQSIEAVHQEILKRLI